VDQASRTRDLAPFGHRAAPGLRPQGRPGAAGGIGFGGSGFDGGVALTPLPGAPEVAYHGDTLQLEGLALSELARRFGTPLYVYSCAAMAHALGGYQRALAGREHLLCYAVKANSSLAILQWFERRGCGFDIVSGGELERALAAGATANRIVFSGVGKTRAEMARALAAGVLCFNVESLGELEALSAVAATGGSIARVSLRINPDVDAKTHPYISTGLRDNKFGIAHADALDVFRRASGLPGIEVVGIDCHIGSQIAEAEPYLEALDRLLDLVEAAEAEGIGIGHIDVGGGLGITYSDENPPVPEALVRLILGRLDARGHGHRKLLLEPGRSLVGNAGVLIAEVLYMKTGETKNFCIVDAAMNDLMRPAMYDAWMRIVECERGRGTPLICDVVGPICESGDWIGRDRPLAAAPGDHIAILSAGAYAMSMASNYNTRGRAAEVMVDGDRAWLIRDRETPADLMRGEHLLPAT
jgi:diaminopimelate decarboxylase